MRAALYARVSVDPHHQGRSVGEQEAECRQVCERNGWTVEQVFVDTDKSASRYAKGRRPGYQQLVRFIEDGQADVLVLWEASRSTRDLEAYVALRKLCRKTDTLLCYNGKLFDLNRGDDSFQTGLDILLAEREVDQTRDRILRAVKANALKGSPHGKLLFGYSREYDPSTGTLVRQVIREDQAALIREAAGRILKGESAWAVAKDWNQRNIPAPKNGQWDTSRMKRILTNPAYIAKRVHQGKVIGEATWPPILDEATYYQLLSWFTDPERQKFHDPAVKYLLSGIATCGVCGGTIKVARPRGYDTYVCSNQFCVARKVGDVDDLVVDLILDRLSQPDALALFAKPNNNRANDLLGQIADRRARLNGFCDAAALGELTPATLGRIEARLTSEIEALEAQLKRVSVPRAVYDLIGAPERWEGLGITVKREIVRTLLEIRIDRMGRGKRTFDPATIRCRFRIGDEV